jgi:hypothetical protein
MKSHGSKEVQATHALGKGNGSPKDSRGPLCYSGALVVSHCTSLAEGTVTLPKRKSLNFTGRSGNTSTRLV